MGGSKTLRSSERDRATLVAAGVTVFEALAAHDALAKDGIGVRVIDLYSVKPLDVATLTAAGEATKLVITVEDHSVCGGLGEAVAAAVAGRARVELLGIREVPRSGKPAELMHAHGIDAAAIVETVKRLLL